MTPDNGNGKNIFTAILAAIVAAFAVVGEWLGGPRRIRKQLEDVCRRLERLERQLDQLTTRLDSSLPSRSMPGQSES